MTTNNPAVASPFEFELVAPEPAIIDPAPRVRVWSPQQEAVFAWVRTSTGSAFVVAVAGAGKTTTLVETCRLMRGSVAFAAYNKAVAVEIQSRIADAGLSNVRAGTFHSFGFSAYARSVNGKIVVDERKYHDAMHAAIQTPFELQAVVQQLVSLAKQSGVGVLWQDGVNAQEWRSLVDHHDLASKLPDRRSAVDELINYAQSAIEWCANATTLITYDDMIWLPLLRNLRMWQNDWVLVDEAQDTNPARRALARRMLKPNGRALFVGDPSQAIYGFTGADADAIARIQQEFGTVQLPLTVTYRCPKSVVKVAQQWVSHIEAHVSAPEGTVRHAAEQEFWTVDVPTLSAKDAILCRNTRPLVALAFALIRKSVPCHVEGRDIGRGLKALASRWKVTSVAALRTNLEAYREREMAKAMAKGQEMVAEAISDKVDTLLVIMEGCGDVRCVHDKIDRLFADNIDGKPAPNLTLSTIHKSKGREWDRVYQLGFTTYCPSPFARQDWQKEQERNLCYVAVTRAKSELVMLPAIA